MAQVEHVLHDDLLEPEHRPAAEGAGADVLRDLGQRPCEAGTPPDVQQLVAPHAQVPRARDAADLVPLGLKEAVQAFSGRAGVGAHRLDERAVLRFEDLVQLREAQLFGPVRSVSAQVRVDGVAPDVVAALAHPLERVLGPRPRPDRKLVQRGAVGVAQQTIEFEMSGHGNDLLRSNRAALSPSPGTPEEGWVGAGFRSREDPHPCPPPAYREREKRDPHRNPPPEYREREQRAAHRAIHASKV